MAAPYVQPVSAGMGEHPMWGYSPAFNLLDYLTDEAKEKEEINVLLASPGDLRHVLATVPHINKSIKKKLNIYIWEDTMECLVRHMLLYKLATDQTASIEARLQTFLEAYGNVVIHKKTSDAIQSTAQCIYKEMAKDSEFVGPFFDLSLLKYKERDAIESVLSFLRKDKGNKQSSFDSGQCWENRCRHYLGSRYDSATNIIDWDYTMRMKYYAPIVHKLHYKRWRLKGVIVERQGKCTESNKSLASFVAARHRKRGPVEVKGFWSDIVVSPYIAFGIHTPELRFYERASKQYKKHSVDICESNLEKILSKIAPCTASNDDTKKGQEESNKEEGRDNDDEDNDIPTILEEAGVNKEGGDDGDQKKIKEGQSTDADSKNAEAVMTPEELAKRVSVRFLAGDFKKMVINRERYKNLFDLAFVSQNIAHLCMGAKRLGKEIEAKASSGGSDGQPPSLLNSVAASKCVVIAESVKYLPVKLREKKLYVQKLLELGKACDWKSLDTWNDEGVKKFSFPMPEEDQRAHAPADATTATKDVRTKEEKESFPECMMPFVFFKITK
mmetsp:Transcript_20657/g.33536  ORF Transcript_20657/g.33536 Transcript_20657/m.33536 type:complete len:556 (-) Transcript_20657:18-1685(-)